MENTYKVIKKYVGNTKKDFIVMNNLTKQAADYLITGLNSVKDKNSAYFYTSEVVPNESTTNQKEEKIESINNKTMTYKIIKQSFNEKVFENEEFVIIDNLNKHDAESLKLELDAKKNFNSNYYYEIECDELTIKPEEKVESINNTMESSDSGRIITTPNGNSYYKISFDSNLKSNIDIVISEYNLTTFNIKIGVLKKRV